MRPFSRAHPALLGASVFALVFLVALGSSRSLASVGGPGHVLGAGPIVGDLAVVLFALALLVFGGIAYAVWPGARRLRGGDEPEWVVEEPESPWWMKPLLLAIGLLPLAGLVTAIVLLRGDRRHVTPPTPTLPPTVTAPVPREPEHAPLAAHWWLLAAVAFLLFAGALILLVRRRLARAKLASAREPRAEELQALIDDSLDEIEGEPDPRRAVIRAYTGMERALARQGLGRRPFEAPLEYLARALVAMQVSRSAGERLTALFQRARFSVHPIEPEMKQEAITALAAVRDELAERAR